MSARPRLLLVGPLPLAGTPIGGTQVSFADLVRRVRASDRLECEVVDTSRPTAGLSRWSRAPSDARALTATLRAIARIGPRCDVVMFNASSGGALAAGPLVWAAARAIEKPFALRVFGGDLDLRVDRLASWRRAAAVRTCLAAPLVLLQTRHLCERFGGLPGVRWLPTTRDLAPLPRATDGRCSRFLFLSQLKPEKGLREALAASDALPDHATLTLCGPEMPGARVGGGHARARFAGAVAPTELAAVLARHDALVFPSWYAGEGMPGAVVEALQAGMPVIASRWRSIPELVEHEANGLLVEPRDVAGLAAAMTRLASDAPLHARLSDGARRTGEAFRGERWHALLESWLVALARTGRVAPEAAEIAA